MKSWLKNRPFLWRAARFALLHAGVYLALSGIMFALAQLTTNGLNFDPLILGVLKVQLA